jgi:hypothetical protein
METWESISSADRVGRERSLASRATPAGERCDGLRHGRGAPAALARDELQDHCQERAKSFTPAT